MLGDPTTCVASHLGNVFYINDVGSAIAKVHICICICICISFSDSLLQDFSSPIFRFVMQEYPEDAGRSMSQVFHGEKILYDMLSDIRPPAVKVNECIYFLDEVLQCLDGQYFIPEHFFYSTQ